MRTLIAFLLAALALLLPGSARSGDAHLLVGTVGPGFTIDVTDAAGKHVSVVPAGRYTFVVHDLSAEHNFVFADKPAGAHVHIETDVAFVGDRTFEVELAPGRYAYACSPHWEVMNGALAAVAPTVAKPAPKPKPKQKKKPPHR